MVLAIAARRTQVGVLPAERAAGDCMHEGKWTMRYRASKVKALFRLQPTSRFYGASGGLGTESRIASSHNIHPSTFRST